MFTSVMCFTSKLCSMQSPQRHQVHAFRWINSSWSETFQHSLGFWLSCQTCRLWSCSFYCFCQSISCRAYYDLVCGYSLVQSSWDTAWIFQIYQGCWYVVSWLYFGIDVFRKSYFPRKLNFESSRAYSGTFRKTN